MTKEQGLEILETHQKWRRGLIDSLPYKAEEFNEAHELAIESLKSNLNGPDWSKAPEWAKWFEIDEKGLGFWHEYEPKKTWIGFRPTGGRIQHNGKLILPTLFKRPE